MINYYFVVYCRLSSGIRMVDAINYISDVATLMTSQQVTDTFKAIEQWLQVLK